jgi:hypothetical protein
VEKMGLYQNKTQPGKLYGPVVRLGKNGGQRQDLRPNE